MSHFEWNCEVHVRVDAANANRRDTPCPFSLCMRRCGARYSECSRNRRNGTRKTPEGEPQGLHYAYGRHPFACLREPGRCGAGLFLVEQLDGCAAARVADLQNCEGVERRS